MQAYGSGVSPCLFVSPRKPHQPQARGEHVLLGWDSRLGPVSPSEYVSTGALPSGRRRSSPAITFPPSFTQRMCILTQATSHPAVWQWGTHRGTARFTDQLWPLSLEVRVSTEIGPSVQIQRSAVCKPPSEALPAWDVAATRQVTAHRGL